MTSYPFLKISKIVLRIIGVLIFVSTLILEISLDNGITTLILTELLGICCCDGVEIIGVIIGIISGTISGFMFFVLAEIIDLFVNMGKNIQAIKNSTNTKNILLRNECADDKKSTINKDKSNYDLIEAQQSIKTNNADNILTFVSCGILLFIFILSYIISII